MFEKINHPTEVLESIEKGSYAKTIYCMAKDILKDNFYRFFNLYYKSLTLDEKSYVVLVTRRAYVLYEIFVLCMQELGRINEIKNNVITSDAIYMLGYGDSNGECYKNSKFIILDDIIINGRTILDVYNKMIELGITEIQIASMEQYENARFLSDIHDCGISDIPKVSEKIWKRDSDALTNLIISSNIGYTSFVSSFIFNQYTKEEWRKLCECFKQKNIALNRIESEALQQNGIDAKAYFFNNEEKSKLNLDDNDNVQICIRLYYSENNDTLTVIPYCFFENVFADKCVNFCNHILSKSKYALTRGLLDFINDNEHKNEKYSLLYKYTINHLNKNAFTVFFNSLSAEIQNKVFFVKSPKENFLKEETWINQITEVDSEFITTEEINIADDKYFYNYAYDCLLSTINTNKDSKENMLSFLNSIKAFDDKNAKDINVSHRCVGIRILDIYNIFKENLGTDYQAILLMIVGLWDEGTAAYNYLNIKCSNGTEAICGFLKNGEQIYNKIYLLYSDVYSYFYRLYNKTSMYRFHLLEHFADYMSKKTLDSKFNVLFNEIKKGSEEHYYSDLGCVIPKKICHKWDEQYNSYLDEYIFK